MTIEERSRERLDRVEEEMGMIKKQLYRHSETIHGVSIGMERINNTISNIIHAQEEHAGRLKEIEALSIISRHWKFIAFTILTIVIVSLCIHVTVKELIGWIM